jgi:hypothetical protein
VASDILKGEELHDALWALANNSAGPKSRIQRVLEVQGFLQKIMILCFTGEYESLVPALRIVGNISAGNEGQTETLLRNDVLRLLEGLLDHKKKNVRKESCWSLSNICAGSKRQVAQLLARPSIFYRVASMLVSDANSIKIEACYVFANMSHMGDPKAVYTVLTELKVLDNLLHIISQDEDQRLLEVGLQALYDLLALAERVAQPNPFVRVLENAMGCFERLEALQHHESMEIYRFVIKIFQRFLNLEEGPDI